MKTRAERFLNPDGSPAHIRCYQIGKGVKRLAYMVDGIPYDNITVVFSHLRLGYYLYLGMSEDAHYCWGEGKLGNFNPAGSRIRFTELPPPCQRLVLREYKEIWKI